VSVSSYAGVPRVSRFCPPDPRAQTLAKLSEVIGEREAGDVLDVFVAELARNAQANRSPKGHFMAPRLRIVGERRSRTEVNLVESVQPQMHDT
jgi:hypothetical protein